jgi:hypothetical protein
MTKGVKHPSPLRIDMGFNEALERFVQTKPEEVENGIKRSKQRKPPGGKKRKRKRKPSGGSSQSVISLRDRRMRKRNKGR